MARGVEGVYPPAELMTYWLCKEHRVLPEGVNLMDQDAELMSRMTYLGRVFEAVQRMVGLKGDAIHNLSPSDSRLLGRLQEEGLLDV